MTSLIKANLVAAVQIGIVVIGGGIAAVTVFWLFTMPPPPPGSDGFAYGMAGFFGGLIILVSLGLATLSVVLPTLLDRDSALGFNRWQRFGVKIAGGMIGLGVLIAVVGGLQGVVLLLGLLLLAYLTTCVLLVWRALSDKYTVIPVCVLQTISLR